MKRKDEPASSLDVSHLDPLGFKRKEDDRGMGTLIDIDARRTNRQIMDIEVRFERDKLFHMDCLKRNARVKRTKPNPGTRGPTWKPGDEPGDLGFPEGPEYD